jgi:hypothetical protein
MFVTSAATAWDLGLAAREGRNPQKNDDLRCSNI